MADNHWSDTELEAARHEGDCEVDRQVEDLVKSGEGFSDVGRLGYNRLLDVADKLLEAPELTLIGSSTVSRQLRSYPEKLVDYFDPMEAPEWVDEAKLQQASELWDQNMLAILGVFYCASLPSCYLIKNGIPALYETAKLREPRYIYQRIYETGLFIDAVMSPGGIQVVDDAQEDIDQHVATALNEADAGGGWAWDGRALRRQKEGTADLNVAEIIESALARRPASRRYLWGKGYIAAKKVRFLHGFMRFMLTRPKCVAPIGQPDVPATMAESLSQVESPWDEDELGKPVNQEDLAYTLLTFSYLIPRGLSNWGCTWTLEEREAFLHLWKTVGYTMGIKISLLTDRWEEAELLFETIRQRQACASSQGRELTDAMIDVLRDYIPPILGLDRSLPPLLIKHQIGAKYSDMIFKEDWALASRKVFPRLMLRIGFGLARVYYLVRNRLFRRSPTLAALMGNVFSQAGEGFIASWRSSYDRRPFYLPANAHTWRRVHGADERFTKRLREWRHKVFYALAVGVALLFASSLGFVVTIAMLALWYTSGAIASGAVTASSFLLALFVLKVSLPHINRKRPQIVNPTQA